MTRRRFLRWLAGAAAAGAALAVTASVVSAHRFQVVRVTATLRRLRAPVRVALLADLHYGPYVRPRQVAAWVRTATALQPDVVVLDGDLVDHQAGGDIARFVDELAALEAPLGVYAAWGNHDHARFGDLSGFERRLRGAGIEVLVNRGARLREDLYLAGIDDFRRGTPDLAAALAQRPARSACVLLSHNPDVLPEVPADVDLTLSGHTHGGQVCLPGIGPLVTSSRYGRRFVHGWVEGPARGYVTRGLGVTLLPVRVDCPAELTVLDLRPPHPA